MNISIRYLPKSRISPTRMTDTARPTFRPSLVPSSTRSTRFAPMFWPVYVVMAVPKVKFGIMAKPSTRITTVLAAITAVPKELVRDWIIIMAKEKMAWVRPLGRPSCTSFFTKSPLGRRVWRFTVSTSFMRISRHRHSAPETAWAIMVAQATPATPIWKPATNQMSSMMLSTQATMRKIRGMMESPRPRRMPEIML